MTTQRVYTSVLHVELGGGVLPGPLAGRLLDGWVDSSVNVPAAFRLAFTDPAGDLMRKYPQIAVGAPAVLSPVTDGRTGQPLLTGEVTAVELDVDALGRTLVVRGYDPGHRLLRNRRVAGYPNMTASDIARRLAGQNNLRIGRIDSTATVYELATQANVTDWDFLAQLARENDVRLYFDERGTLQFTALSTADGAPADTTEAEQSPYVLEFGANLLTGSVGLTSAGGANTVSVRGWDMRTKRALTSDAPAATSKDAKPDLTPSALGARFGTAQLTGTTVPYTTQSQVDHAATALAHDVAGSSAELEVEVAGNPQLRPGLPVALARAGFPFEGKFTVTGVRHVFPSGQPYRTRVVVSGRQFRSLYGLLAGGGTAPSLPGVAVALVTNIKDPLRMGRVRLHFPWLSETYESDWCRVAQFGGVAGGGLLLPEVDDEVLVAFDRGALEHPYVLAGLYNGKDHPTPDPDRIDPVDGTRGAVNWRSIASRNGHMIELLDATTRAAQGIRLRTGNGALTVQLDQAKTAVTITSDGSVRIHGAGKVEVDAGAELSLNAIGAVNIQGSAVNITGTGAVSVKAGGALTLTADGLVSVDAVGAINVNAVAALALTAEATATLTAPTITINGAAAANGVPLV